MTIKRYIANKDNTITNAYRSNNTTRATNANMGGSDILEVYSIYGQIDQTSIEKSRILIQFPIEKILADRNANLIGNSGSCQFILKLSNAPNFYSTPENIKLNIFQVSGNWSEGVGLDMEDYSDVGVSNWLSSSKGNGWITEGGDYFSDPIETTIVEEIDDLEVDITSFVEKWIDGTIINNGLLIKLTSSLENGDESYFTKMFFGRKSQFFFKRPYIEVRSNNSIKDDRYNFNASSLALSETDNLNTLYLFNRVNGSLKNIYTVDTGTLNVSLYTGTLSTGPFGSPIELVNGLFSVTGGYISTGIYTASLGVRGNYEYLWDIWSDISGNILHTGSAIEVKQKYINESSDIKQYNLSMPSLKNIYNFNEVARFRVVAKDKVWNANLFDISRYEPQIEIIENLYFKINRIVDNYEVIPYGTGSMQHTLTSYDKSGNYFDLDLSLLEPGYSYKITLTQKIDNNYYEFKETFKFRVE